MLTQIQDDQVADTHVVADSTTQRVQNVVAQLVRQGQDTSLRSLQVWAELARQLGATAAVCSPAGATRVRLAYALLDVTAGDGLTSR